jgi:single-stranded DNA-binding protein
MNDDNPTLNDLNSVLLGGTVAKEPVVSYDPKGVPRCLLVIASERYLRYENGMEKQTTDMQVYTKGRLAEQCMKCCHAGRKVRVVGRLQILSGKNTEGRAVSRVVIEAEHVEVKPEMTRNQKKEPSYDSYSR